MTTPEKETNRSFPCYHGVAHPWLCDVMRHLTTRNYMAMFDDASYRLLFCVFDYDASAKSWRGLGWADIQHTIRYVREVPVGAPIEISGRLLEIGKTSLSAHYELRVGLNPEPAATLEAVSVFFDLEERRAISLTAEMRAKAGLAMGRQ